MLPVHQSERPDQSEGNSPIHLAAARGNIEAVRILMESNTTKDTEPINKRYFILFEKLGLSNRIATMNHNRAKPRVITIFITLMH